jgi:phenylalanine-4-hydroxylase
MKVKLMARALWSVIEDGIIDQQEKMMTFDALCGAVPPEMVSTIAKKETTKEAWDAIAMMRIDDNRVKKVMTQQLCQKYDLATFEDYTLRLNGMAVYLATLDDVVKEGEIIAKILCTLPSRFKQHHQDIARRIDDDSR